MSVVAVSALAALGAVVAYGGLIFGGLYAACALSDRRRALQLAHPGAGAHLRRRPLVARVVAALRARLTDEATTDDKDETRG